MPAISPADVVVTASKVLSARQDNNRPGYARGQYNLTPSMLSFLCPLFLIVILGPLVIILCVRKRRRQRAMQNIAADVRAGRSRTKKNPVISQEEAWERLEGATEVVSAVDGGKEKQSFEVVEKEGDAEKCEWDEDRDCAICLSTLSTSSLTTPLPPASLPTIPTPAKLPLSTTIHREDISQEPQSPTPVAAPPQNSDASRKVSSEDSDSIMATKADQILRLRNCKHEFHGACLLSWCVVGKVSCPVCRYVFFELDDGAKEGAEGASDANANANRGSRLRTTTATVVEPAR